MGYGRIIPHDSDMIIMGRLWIMHAGPKSLQQTTPAALKAIAQADAAAGDPAALEMLEPVLGKKELVSAEEAAGLAAAGKTAAIVFDSPEKAGAFLRTSAAAKYADIDVLPAVSAAEAASARLGAVISGDYAVVRAARVDVPWEKTERRLECAFQMGAPVVLYEPKNETRPFTLGKTIAIAARCRAGTTPVGVVRNAFSGMEETFITTLDALGEYDELIDADSVVIIGGEETKIWEGADGDIRIV